MAARLTGGGRGRADRRTWEAEEALGLGVDIDVVPRLHGVGVGVGIGAPTCAWRGKEVRINKGSPCLVWHYAAKGLDSQGCGGGHTRGGMRVWPPGLETSARRQGTCTHSAS